MNIYQQSLDLQKKHKGKIDVILKVGVRNEKDHEYIDAARILLYLPEL